MSVAERAADASAALGNGCRSLLLMSRWRSLHGHPSPRITTLVHSQGPATRPLVSKTRRACFLRRGQHAHERHDGRVRSIGKPRPARESRGRGSREGPIARSCIFRGPGEFDREMHRCSAVCVYPAVARAGAAEACSSAAGSGGKGSNVWLLTDHCTSMHPRCACRMTTATQPGWYPRRARVTAVPAPPQAAMGTRRGT